MEISGPRQNHGIRWFSSHEHKCDESGTYRSFVSATSPIYHLGKPHQLAFPVEVAETIFRQG